MIDWLFNWLIDCFLHWVPVAGAVDLLGDRANPDLALQAQAALTGVSHSGIQLFILSYAHPFINLFIFSLILLLIDSFFNSYILKLILCTFLKQKSVLQKWCLIRNIRDLRDIWTHTKIAEILGVIVGSSNFHKNT